MQSYLKFPLYFTMKIEKLGFQYVSLHVRLFFKNKPRHKIIAFIVLSDLLTSEAWVLSY